MNTDTTPSAATVVDAAATPPGAAPSVDADGNPTLVDVPAELEPERPPLIDEHGRVRLSFSAIEQYSICPRKFRYQKVDRLPGRPAPALSFGNSVHTALERFYDRKLPEEPTEEELVAFLYDAWDSSGFADVDREEQKRWYSQGQEVLRRYHRKVTGAYRLPVATEQWFELPFDDAVVVGSIDRVDSDEDDALHVVDYKTNKRAKTRDQVAGSLQLAIYALACEHLYGQLPATVALDFVVAGVEVRVGIDEIDLDAARRAVHDTAQAVRAGAFEPTPMRLCDWCDYRSICSAWQGEDPDETLGAVEAELQSLRRSVARDVARLRALEDGSARIRTELAEREAVEAETAAAIEAMADAAMPDRRPTAEAPSIDG